MTTTSINKIARGNLKPWIAAKTATEIVSSYVQKLYKQIPDNFQNDLLKHRLTIPKSENRAPLRKVVPQKFNIPIISTKPTSKLRCNGYRSPAITRKNSFVTAPKKFLKTPNFKIYTNRRYASSISSSKSSFVRNKSNTNEEYRRKIYKPVQGFQKFRGIESLIPNTFHYGQSFKPVDVSHGICKDLMPIDDVLKKKICPVKQKLPSVEPLKTPKQDLWNFSVKDWNNPSMEHYNKLTTIPVIRKPSTKCKQGSFVSGLSSFRLMPVKQKQFGGKLSNSGAAPKKVNPKLQSSGSSYYKRFSVVPNATQTRRVEKYESLGFGSLGGVNSRFNGLKIPGQPSKEKSNQKSCDLKNALDFVCLSRAEQSIRSRNKRGFQTDFRL